MITADELEKLKHPGKFELLATAVLSKAEREYRAILHSGINAQGQPIKSPVDGFCRVPGSDPPHFILVEHTVEAKLEKKWLYDHQEVQATVKGRKKQLSESDDGDLLKAGHLAQTIKTEFPDAKFTVVLTTNQGLKPDLCLKVEKKAKQLDVSVDFWDQSRIARFLDAEPEGQWLRKEYLDITAEMLSETLLHDLCCKSLEGYRKQFITQPDQWVARQVDQQVKQGIDNRSCSMQLLIGESGSGKSVAAYQAGRKHLEEGGYSLWLSENVLAVSDSLENALDKALHDLQPSLMAETGKTVLQLLKHREKMLLIADDVNRTSSPTNLLQKLVNWSKPFLSSVPNANPSSPYLLICPVWSDVIRSITPGVDKTSWIGSVFIGTMVPEEGTKAIKDAVSLTGFELTSVEATALAEKLGNDPILIGLFTSLLAGVESSELSHLAENVVERFIAKAISEVSQTGNLLAEEYRSALSKLTTQMLKGRKLNPVLANVKEWLGDSSEEMQALRALVKHGNLCQIENGKLGFRHDRLREAMLVESMGQLLNNAAEPLDIFWEPYYAEIIGQAIVQYPQSEEFLKQLCDRLPLALVEAIRYFGDFIDNYHRTIVNSLKTWIDHEVVSGSALESVLDAICLKLETIDSPIVLEITKKLPSSWFSILLARFRNGCTMSGIQYLTHFSQEHSALIFRDALRDQAIEQAKRYHKNKILKELKKLLVGSNITDIQRRSALALAGFLSFADLCNEVQTCWEISNDKVETLPETFWAAIRCNNLQSWEFLDQLMKYWDDLPFNPVESGASRKSKVTVGISSALKLDHHDGIICYLINRVRKHKTLHSYISSILRNIDSPEALEFITRDAADIPTKDHPNSFAIQTVGLADAWNPLLSSNHKLSQLSMKRLEILWEEPSNDSFLRRIAFHIWEMGVGQNEIKILQKVKPDSPIYYQALRKRANLSDYSVVPTLLPLLINEADWLHVANYIWCNEIMIAVKPHIKALENIVLKNFSTDYSYEQSRLSRLLTQIPKQDAEKLLDEYWKHLGYSPLFIQTAFYIGTPRCLELAENSLTKCPEDIFVFEHFSSHFYLTDENREKYINSKELQKLVQSLLPHLDRFDDFEIWRLAEACKKFRISEWSKQYLVSKLSDEFRKRCHPIDSDLLEDLEGFLTDEDGIQQLTLWLKAYEKKNELDATVVNNFVALHPTEEGLIIAARCLQSMGIRENLAILENVRGKHSIDKFTRIKLSTQFAIFRRTLD